jgi:hypothetical protein
VVLLTLGLIAGWTGGRRVGHDQDRAVKTGTHGLNLLCFGQGHDAQEQEDDDVNVRQQFRSRTTHVRGACHIGKPANDIGDRGHQNGKKVSVK